LITGITETTRSDIVRAIEQFVVGRTAVPLTNADVAELAAVIAQMVDSPARAALISSTEVNRAMTHAAIALYKRSNIHFFNLVNVPGACAVCVEVAANNPHPVGDLSATSPLHPCCRCHCAPVVTHQGGTQ